MQALIGAAEFIAGELLLFAAIGLLLCGIDDIVIDGAWIARSLYRRIVRRASTSLTACDLTHGVAGRIAILIPAWDEGTIIGTTVARTLASLRDPDFAIYVGLYPNDDASRRALAAIDDPRLRIAVNPRPGPTTKADCLNVLWRALTRDDVARGAATLAVVLHDAEDIVHPDELRTFRAYIDRFDLIQLPVLPIVNPRSLFIEGHYADEFAESHGKDLVIRAALHASIPAAGVGCAFRRDILARVAAARDGLPFDPASLVEDYELGLRIAEIGARSAFIRIRAAPGEPLVAVRSSFPTTVAASVRQKGRWIAGIALAGWDRLGWRGGLAERWFRLHDRKALFAALVIFAAYVGMLVAGVSAFIRVVLSLPLPPPDARLTLLFLPCTALLAWRLLMRVAMTARVYGPLQGLLAIPRMVVGNAIAILAVRRAVGSYVGERRDGIVRWDKTANRLPGS